MTHIIPTAEPFFFQGKTNIGVLLTHGFTGTPKEMRWMGEYLHKEAGFTCLGPRLSGHATQPQDMIRSTRTDWISSVEDGYNLLKDSAEDIYLCGLSMGGVLSLLAASYLPINGVIALATPYALQPDWRLNFTELLSNFMPFLPKSKNPPGSGWFDKQAYQAHTSYPRNPLRSVGELNKLLAEMRDALPKVTVPVLLINSKDDTYLPMGSEQSLNYIYDHLGSANKQKLLISGSGHVLTRDAQRETVFKATIQFIQQTQGEPS